jgi:hypothetical protein
LFYALASIPLLFLVYQRLDFWSVLAATIAVVMWRRQRPAAAALAIAAGTALKLWPIVLAPLLWTGRDPRRGGRVAMAGVVAGALALWFVLAGSSGVLQVLTFRDAHGWQIESLVGNLIELAGQPVRLEAGAHRVGWTAGWLSLAMFAAAAPLSVWSMWRGARIGRVGTSWLAAAGAVLVFSALLSTQFVMWLVPPAAIAWTEGDRRPAALAATVALLTGAYSFVYRLVFKGVTLAVLAVTARNVLLVAMVIVAVRLIARPRCRRSCS